MPITHCPSCRQPQEGNARFCDGCGAELPASRQPRDAPPRFELQDFHPQVPAGASSSFRMCLTTEESGPLQRAVAQIHCHPLKAERDRITLDCYGPCQHQEYFRFTAPGQGGSFPIKFVIECIDPEGRRRCYKGATSLLIHGNAWNTAAIGSAIEGIKGPTVEINNEGGLVRGLNAPHAGRIVINNKEGLTRIEGPLGGPAVAGEVRRIELCPSDDRPLKPPAETRQACLIHPPGSEVKRTRVFAQEEVVLGRPAMGVPGLPADLWLSLYPLENPRHQARMDCMSGRHASIRFKAGQFEIRDHSRHGTWLNGNRLDPQWTPIEPGGCIQFQHPAALTLKAHLLRRGALRLTREDNAPDEEDFLLLAPGAAPEGPADGLCLDLCHDMHGILLRADSDDIQAGTVPLNAGQSIGLQDGDRILREGRAHEFRTRAYPEFV